MESGQSSTNEKNTEIGSKIHKTGNLEMLIYLIIKVLVHVCYQMTYSLYNRFSQIRLAAKKSQAICGNHLFDYLERIF